jgi:hypothetical protein
MGLNPCPVKNVTAPLPDDRKRLLGTSSPMHSILKTWIRFWTHQRCGKMLSGDHRPLEKRAKTLWWRRSLKKVRAHRRRQRPAQRPNSLSKSFLGTLVWHLKSRNVTRGVLTYLCSAELPGTNHEFPNKSRSDKTGGNAFRRQCLPPAIPHPGVGDLGTGRATNCFLIVSPVAFRCHPTAVR